MIKFSKLLTLLIFCSSTKEKTRILINYLNKVDTYTAGYTIAALTNNLKFKKVKSNYVREIVKKKIDKVLFALSYDYVGDTADTISLIWEKKSHTNFSNKSIRQIIEDLNNDNIDIEKYIINFLDSNELNERWAFIKLLLGGYRIGVSANFIKNTLAIFGNKKKDEIENIWNGLKPPYLNLIRWLKNEADYPQVNISETFHSMMLANSINLEKDQAKINPKDYSAEYKWDGIRVQISSKNGKTRIFSRSGDDISFSFPEITLDSKKLIVLDGELLAGINFKPFSFSKLQKRLNKKKPSKNLINSFPVFIRLYDILFFNDIDLRNKNLIERKKVLNKFFSKINSNNFFDLSTSIEFTDFKMLNNIYLGCTKSKFIEGLMLKKNTSHYIAGRKKDFWLKWKRTPKLIDGILMYAQRGHGKRSSYYSDFTLGVYNKDKVIVPIAKAYSGFTDKELQKLDKFVRENTIKKYGPVREVKKILVVELAFDSMQESNRHKSGVSLRFPRFHRIRWDKPSQETTSLDQLIAEFMN